MANANSDVLIPFASIDPHKGRRGVDEARRLIADHGVRGFKFHPNVQGFFPNDRMAYPLYAVIEEAGLPALFHTGHSGVGSGLPGGGGSASSTPTRSTSTTSPSTSPNSRSCSRTRRSRGRTRRSPSRCTSRRSTSTSPAGRRSTSRRSSSITRTRCCATSAVRHRLPAITPDRWLADFDKLDIKPEVRPLILKENAMRLLGLGGSAG